MSSIKKVLCFEETTYANPSGTMSVEDYLDEQFNRDSMSRSASDSYDQAQRIDHLETVVAKLADALFQTGGLSAEQVLELTGNGYMAEYVTVEDEK